MKDDKIELKLEALKMVKEWSTWLAGLQAGICALLWGPLKDSLKPVAAGPFFPPEPMPTDLIVLLHFGWFAFLFSLLLTALLLILLPRMIERLEQNKENGKSIFQESLVWKISLGKMLWAIYVVFFLGPILTGVFVLLRAMK